MTWDELTALLNELGQENDLKVHAVTRDDGLDAVALHLAPVAWFIALKFTGSLNMGTYEGDDHRMTGTEQMPLAELTPEFVREQVKKAAKEQFTLTLDPQLVSDFPEKFPRPQMRDIEGIA